MRGHTKKSFKFSVKATFTITRVAPRGVLAVGSSRGDTHVGNVHYDHCDGTGKATAR